MGCKMLRWIASSELGKRGRGRGRLVLDNSSSNSNSSISITNNSNSSLSLRYTAPLTQVIMVKLPHLIFSTTSKRVIHLVIERLLDLYRMALYRMERNELGRLLQLRTRVRHRLRISISKANHTGLGSCKGYQEVYPSRHSAHLRHQPTGTSTVRAKAPMERCVSGQCLLLLTGVLLPRLEHMDHQDHQDQGVQECAE